MRCLMLSLVIIVIIWYSYLITQYLTELDNIGFEYPIETYKAFTVVKDSPAPVTVKVLPPHFTDSGIQYCMESKGQVSCCIYKSLKIMHYTTVILCRNLMLVTIFRCQNGLCYVLLRNWGSYQWGKMKKLK